MKIGATSQNWCTVTGHAGKARRVLDYSPGVDGRPVEVDRIDLPKEMCMQADNITTRSPDNAWSATSC